MSDMLWNAGSPEFARQAALSGRPIVGFVDGAPEGRGFSNHELPVIRQAARVSFNGQHLAGAEGDGLEAARKSAVTFSALEAEMAGAASLHSNRLITTGHLRSRVDLSYGFNGTNNTVFGQPREIFARQTIEEMTSTADKWSRIHARTVGDVSYRTPVEHGQALVQTRTLALRSGGALALTPEAAGMDADFSRDVLTRRAPSGGLLHATDVAGRAAIVLDATVTARSVTNLQRSGNQVGATSEVVHFAGRNLGGWGGAVAGAQAAALAGAETGPGALVAGTVGAIAGAVAGEKIANKVDDYRTYHQNDSRGQSWQMDPANPDRGWTRSETRLDPNGPTVPGHGYSAPAYKTETITAPPETANELNYKASGVQVQLALAHPPTPRNPYSVEAKPTDAPSLREAKWQRDPNTLAWRREVTTGYMEHGLPMTRTDVASPQRTQELDQSSARIAEENRANRPLAIAERYLEAHREYGWERFGKPEAAAVAAANAPRNVLEASDGNEYKRGPDGAWKHETLFGHESRATGNIRDELNEAARSNGIHAPSMKQGLPTNPTQDRITEMLEAARNGDWNKFRQDTQAFAEMQPGQQLQQNAVQQANQIEQHAEQQRAAQVHQQQNEQQQQQTQQQAHGPRMTR
ncbi:hypothetical protein L2Y96_20530 [Luteibacter aegosomaticola]|uniref:hypothetical protein n=1 Tax=Luteibacter aegosomaticola TaxID=2911538 RepID=UPI001FFAFB17|nr:hypothetical protein [Luteibacter aegosomaticola]UPG89748.1 hypothetical protein L2Y96_20530 [Luteibacter aegosomaticola]